MNNTQHTGEQRSPVGAMLTDEQRDEIHDEMVNTHGFAGEETKSMVEYVIDATLAKVAEQKPAFYGFFDEGENRLDLCFTPSSPRRDGIYATAFYAAILAKAAAQQRAKAAELADAFMCGLSWMRANREDVAYDRPSQWKEAAEAYAERVAVPQEAQGSEPKDWSAVPGVNLTHDQITLAASEAGLASRGADAVQGEPIPMVQASAPAKIWLVIGEDCEPDDDFNDLQEITWCQDKIDDNAIPYIREDKALPSSVRADVEASGDAHQRNGLAWAVSKWNDEVSNRPMVNVHRRSLDDTWRQVIRYFGGNPDKIVGPSHDAIYAANGNKHPAAPSPTGAVQAPASDRREG